MSNIYIIHKKINTFWSGGINKFRSEGISTFWAQGKLTEFTKILKYIKS